MGAGGEVLGQVTSSGRFCSADAARTELVSVPPRRAVSSETANISRSLALYSD
jgi:hypothetical protein